MKLLSCYIAGFGKFKDVKFDLSKDLVVIKADNGWGKTTLATFIESMLFGMEASRAKGAQASARVRYQPFTGGAFGGVLEVLADGRRYRIERTFSQTPAGDTCKVYDENNRPVPDFAGVNIGEAILGVSRESFRRSAYIPQEKQSQCVPEDMKGRLLALLSGDGNGESAGIALARLEDAERKLRAKRKPAKGKLDILEERLYELARQKDEALQSKDQAQAIALRIAEREKLVLGLEERLQTLGTQTEEATRAEGAYLARGSWQAENARLQEFFAGNDPKTVNTDGLSSAVSEFYQLKNELADMQSAETLQIQIQALEKNIQAYQAVLGKEAEAEKADEKLKKERRALGKKQKWTLPIIVLSLLLTLFGAIQISPKPALGYCLFFVGVLGVAFGALRLLKSVPPRGKKRGNSQIREEYENAKAEMQRLQALSSISPTQAEEKRARMQTLESAIVRFLSAFRFDGEIYDYRAALKEVKDNIARFTERESAFVLSATGELQTLKKEYREKEKEREKLKEECVRLKESLKGAEEKASAYVDIQNEENALKSEYARLQERLQAIVIAKAMLLKARDNMAGRYLLPVQKACAEYLRFMGYRGEHLRFTPVGEPMFDEQGGMREIAYYSEGVQGLVGFCMRVALATLVFSKQTPPLILDDPFVDLDDSKTERAKALVKELSGKYQIIYFTCKEERRI